MFSNYSLKSKLLLLVSLPCAALLLFGVFAFTSAKTTQSDLQTLKSKELALSNAANDIRYLDEVLTHSAARFISSRGDEKWWTRYDTSVAKLDAALKVATDNANAADLQELDKVADANTKLIALEEQIRDLVRAKQFDTANALLDGEYDEQKDIYSVGVDKFFTASQTRIAQVIDKQSAQASRTSTLLILLSLIALGVIAAAFAMARSIGKPVQRLTDLAREAATTNLPAALAQVQSGQSIELPRFNSQTNDEIGELGRSFDQFQDTAVALASEQAALRVNVTEMLVNLGRRNQALLNKTLKYISEMERDERDEHRLQSLFRLDHMATRVRRNAESLLVLAGSESSRISSRPVSIADVVNASLSEVEDYARVNIDRIDAGFIKGTAAAEVAHLLSELIENAASFSPPDTPVTVTARQRGSELHIFVVDEGIGMEQAQMQTINERLAATDENEIHTSKSLGLVVVGKLARRHGIDVRVSDQVNGIAVKVVIPAALLQAEVQTARPAQRTRTAQTSAAAQPLTSRPTTPLQSVQSQQPVDADHHVDPDHDVYAGVQVDDIHQASSSEMLLDAAAADAGVSPTRRQRGAQMFESGRASTAQRPAADPNSVGSKLGSFQSSVRSAQRDIQSGELHSSAPSPEHTQQEN
jgi:signal transduction histidine kinase